MNDERELTCPAGVITGGRLFDCGLALNHPGMHYAEGAYLHWWGAIEAADIRGTGTDDPPEV